jgi:hypothetical protein
MKIQKIRKQSTLKKYYLLMLIVVVVPVVLNLYAPTLMGRWLRNSIMTAGILVFGLWAFLSIIFSNASSCDQTVLI